MDLRKKVLNFLLDFLEEKAGDYVLGLKKEHVQKVAKEKGTFRLTDLQLNAHALNQLRLPLNIHHGSIQEIFVDLHLRSAIAESKPIKVEVHGVYILVGPSDRNQWNKQEMRRRRLDLMEDSLKKAEKALRKALSKGDINVGEKVKKFMAKKLPGYAKTFIDNLTVTISDIHIRYEDTIAQPGQSIAAGLTLDEFMICTTDATFEINNSASEARLSNSRFGRHFRCIRKKHGGKNMIFKLCQLSQMAVYWNPDCDMLFHSHHAPQNLFKDASQKSMDPSKPRDTPKARMEPFISRSKKNVFERSTDPSNPRDTPKPRDLSMSRESKMIQNRMESLISRSRKNLFESIGNFSAESLKDWYILRPLDVKVTFTHHMKPPDSSKTAIFELEVQIASLNVAVDVKQTQQMLAVKKNLDRTAFYEKMFPFRPEESVSENPRAWWKYAFASATKKYLRKLSMSEVVQIRKRYIALYVKKLKDEKSLQKDEVVELEDYDLSIPIQAIALLRVQAHNIHKDFNLDIQEVEVAEDLESDQPIIKMAVCVGLTLALTEDKHKRMCIEVKAGIEQTIFSKGRIVIKGDVGRFEVFDESNSLIKVRCPGETSQILQQTSQRSALSTQWKEGSSLLNLTLTKDDGSMDINIEVMPIEFRINKDPIFQGLPQLAPETIEHLKHLGMEFLRSSWNAISKETISVKVSALIPKIMIPVDAAADKGILVIDMDFVELEGNQSATGSLAVRMVVTDVKVDLALRMAHLKDNNLDTRLMKGFNVSVHGNNDVGPQGIPIVVEVSEPIIFKITPERMNNMVYFATSVKTSASFKTPTQRGKWRKFKAVTHRPDKEELKTLTATHTKEMRNGLDASTSFKMLTKLAALRRRVQRKKYRYEHSQKVNVTLEEFQVIIVNDIQGQDQPLLTYKVSDLSIVSSIDLATFFGMMDLDLSVLMQMDFYNPQLMEFEPLLEDFKPKVKLKQDSSGSIIKISSETPLQMNVSTEILTTMLEIFTVLVSDLSQEEGRENQEKAKHSSIHFSNDTGLPVTLVLSQRQQEQIEVGSGDCVALNIHQNGFRRRRSLLDLDEYQTITLRFGGDMASSLQPLPGLKIFQHRSLIYQVLPAKPSVRSKYLYSDPVLEETWEYHRRLNSKQWIPPDNGQWLDKSMQNKRLKEELSLPDDKWVWLDEWHVDDTHPLAEAGWMYGSRWADLLGSDEDSHNNKYKEYKVRRRRWLRTRGPRIAPYKDPNRPLQMLWHSEVTHSGKISITARSLIRVKNCTSTQFEVKVSHVSESQGCPIGFLHAQKELPVPLLNAYCSHLQVRPVGDGSHDWSLPALSIAQTPLTMEKVTIQCEPAKSNSSSQQWATSNQSVFFNAHVQSIEENIIVTIYPLIEVVNVLPCNLKYRFSFDALPQFNRGTLAPGETVEFNQINMTHKPRLQIRMGRYSWSQNLPLLEWLEQRDSSVKSQFHLSNGEGQYHIVQASLTGNSKRTIRVEIFCKYWLVNKTGLPIDFGFQHEKIVLPKGFKLPEEEKTELSSGSLHILHLKVKSKGHYTVDNLDNGMPMYTDKPFQWSNLPDKFRNQPYICTSSGDKNLKGEGLVDFMQFEVNNNAVVYILFDLHCKKPPKWLTDSGFVRTEEVIQTKHKELIGKTKIDYQIWKQSFVAKSSVRLGSNRSAKVMYSVVIAPDGQIPITYKESSFKEDLDIDRSEFCQDIDEIWDSGLNGFCLYSPQTARNHEMIGICIEESWSEDLDISKEVEKDSFEIHSPENIYNLTLSSKSLPGVFHKSKMILVAPHYMIVNGLPEPILVRQVGTPETQSILIHPHSKENFHHYDRHQPKEILFRVKYKTQWAYGSIKIGHVGAIPLHLPSRGRADMVLHVQVVLAKSSEDCAVMVVVTQAQTPSQQFMRVDNICGHPVRFYQKGAPSGSAYVLSPSKAVEFGWLYPANPKVLLLSIDGLNAGQKEIKMDKLGTKLKFVTEQYSAIAVLENEGATKIIRIIEENKENESQLEAAPPASTKNLDICMDLKSVGVSIITNFTQRREAFYVHIENPIVKYHQNADKDGIELMVQSFQVDNHIEGTLFPVLFYSKPPAQNNEEAPAFFHLSLAKPMSKGTHSIFIHYLAFQIAEFSIQVDRTTMEEVLRIIAPLKPVSSDEAIALRDPHRWMNNFTSNLLKSDPAGRVDVDQVIKSTQGSKLYFQNLHFHPIKFNLTVYQDATEAHKSNTGFDVLELLRNAGSIENAHIRLKSFLVDHAVVGQDHLAIIIGKHYALQFTTQILSVLGSFRSFGEPANLLSEIGTGVHDLFYEPFHGAVQSPGKFVTGLGKGATSIFQHTVGGTLNSVAGIGDDISTNISYLSFDKEYTAKRKKRMLEVRIKGGIKEGLEQSGSSLLGGFAEGCGGAFTKPITEAKKNRVPGFFAGLGMGAAGIVVKPIVGIADASMLVVQGLANELASEKRFEQIRYRRPLHLSPLKGGFILKVYSIQSADAQALVDSTASTTSSNLYHSDIKVGSFLIIFSEKLLIIKEDECDPQEFKWTDFCHLEKDGLCVRVKQKEGDPVEISCPDESTMFKLYSHFESKLSKLLDSQSIIHLEDILARRSSDDCGEESKKQNAVAEYC